MKSTFKFEEWKNQGKMVRASHYISRKKSNVPWVIFCHGFSGHRIGPNYLYVSIARHLASEGINTLIFDFTGCGESDGYFSELTISSMCSDLISAYYFLKNNYGPEKIILFGHSFGGTIAAISAHTILVNDLVLLSPLANTEKHVQIHEKILKKGKNENGFFEFGPHEMSISFLEEMKALNPVYTFSQKFKGRMILLQGETDEQITLEESLMYVNTAKNSIIKTEYHVIKNADHQFSTVDSRKFLQKTITSWIKENSS